MIFLDVYFEQANEFVLPSLDEVMAALDEIEK